MSHTTTVKIAITDTKAIRQAVRDLQKQGVDVTLHEGAIPRMYYKQQSKAVGTCQFVVRPENGPYDLGLKKDGDEYVMYFDDYQGRLSQHIGEPGNREAGPKSVSRFTQRYTVNATKNALMAQGHEIVDEVEAEDGSIALTIAA